MPTLDTKLTAVVVYTDRARLTRAGKIALEPGSHSLEIPNLPLELKPESLRATARGTARARLSGVQCQRTFFTETPAEQVRQLESELEAAQDESLRLGIQSELVLKQRTNLAAIGGHTETFALGLAGGEMSLQAQKELFADLRDQMEKLDTEVLALGVRKREVERRVEKLKNQLSLVRNARPHQRYTALVEVEILQAGELSVELSYLVTGASWQPLYDLRLQEDGQSPQLELSYLAQVSQKTGEDWQEAALALSTARPALAGAIPELDPWYIQPRPVLTPRAFAVQHGKADMVMAAAAPAMEPPPGDRMLAEVPAEIAQAAVETSGAAVTYHVPALVSVPADGQPHKVSVAIAQLPARLDYVTAPKLVEAVYRRATVANDSPYTLLAGQANLFAGEEFIGVTALELTAPKGEIELFFGVDDRVKVERELKRREVDKTLIGGKRRIHVGYEIKLENLLATEAKVLIRDQIPVPRHEEIKVRLESTDPRPTRQTELNLLDWDLTLASKEKRALRFDFTIEYPPTLDVIGLP